MAAVDDANLVPVLLPHLRTCGAGTEIADGIGLLAALAPDSAVAALEDLAVHIIRRSDGEDR